MPLEKTHLHIGFVALSDCAPLVVALEKHFFAAQGLTVTLSREPSWANIRDKVILGVLDAAQMLSSMPLAITLGLGGVQTPMLTAWVLSLNGNAITLSRALYERLQTSNAGTQTKPLVSAQSLQPLLAQQDRLLTFASVFPFSLHNYQLRAWLAAGGIDPDRDVQLMTVPPPQMVAHLEAGLLDGFCVGAPWNNVAVAQGLGHTLITSKDITPNSPEKVLGVTQAWAQQHPHTHLALLRALRAAAQWLDSHRAEAVELIARPDYLDLSPEIVRLSLQDQILYAPGKPAQHLPDFHLFYGDQTNRPTSTQAETLLRHMQRWKQLEDSLESQAIAARVYREDIYLASL